MYLNTEQQSALELMKSGRNVFLRGDAGTGKTVVINRFVDSDPDRIVSLAPTGLAASNLKHGGMTIHRFLGALSQDWTQRLDSRPGEGSGIPALSSQSDHRRNQHGPQRPFQPT